MAETKTKPTEISARAYIAALPDAKKRADAEALLALFERVTGEPAIMWGPSMIGFGSYDYVYDSGHSGSAMRGGFAPRKANIVLYLMGSYGDGGVEHSPPLPSWANIRRVNPAFMSTSSPMWIWKWWKP